MKATTVSKVNSAIAMLRSGVSIRKVAEKLSLSKSTVGRIKLEHCPGVQNSKGGRPRVLSEAERRYCVRKATKEKILSAVKITKLLEEDFKVKVNPETVRRALRSTN